MKNERTQQILELKRLSIFLDKHYDNELNFRNHCYLRIAYDITTRDKWDNKVAKPFVKYANNVQLQNVIDLLKKYSSDKKSLLSDNEKSLNFRKLNNFKNENSINTLF